MLWTDQFGEEPVATAPDLEIGEGIKLVYELDSRMQCTVRRSSRVLPSGAPCPTLVIDGSQRAPDDWFGIEIELPPQTSGVTMTCRNYPVHRLFPRLHFDVLGETQHLDLAHVAAHDAFATRLFDAAEWREAPIFRDGEPDDVRLTVLVPSTPWFAMEIQAIEVRHG